MQKNQWIKSFLLFSFLFSFSGCQLLNPENRSSQPVKGDVGQGKKGAGVAHQEMENKDTEPQVSMPDFIQRPIPKVGLLLGPGGARSMAHLGVLQALQEQKIPLSAIAGLEWGALIAGLYANSGELHDIDWKLSQLPQFKPGSASFFSSKQKSLSLKELRGYLAKTFGKSKVQDSDYPFGCGVTSLKANKTKWLSKGAYVNLLKLCLPHPPQYGLTNTFAASYAFEEAMAFFRSKGIDKVVFVDVMPGQALESMKAWKEKDLGRLSWFHSLRSRNLFKAKKDVMVISINTSNYKMTDWKKRLQLIREGKTQAASQLNDVRKKMGL